MMRRMKSTFKPQSTYGCNLSGKGDGKACFPDAWVCDSNSAMSLTTGTKGVTKCGS